MIHELIGGLLDQFKHQLANNQFLIGMLMTGMLGAGAYLLRKVPHTVGRFFFRLFTIEVTFRSDEEGFDMANEFVLKHVLVESFSRVFIMALGRMARRRAQETSERRYFQPGYGKHFGWYHRRPVLVNRTVERDSNSSNFKEEVTLTFFSRNRAILESFAGQAHGFMRTLSSAESMRIYVSSGDYWSEHIHIVRRDLATVFVPDADKLRLVKHIETFAKSEQTYLQRGMPYHTGIFLSGPPGVGKSSIIHALASHFRRSIYYLNLASLDRDGDLMDLLGRDWSSSLLVIEDIDVANDKKGRKRSPRPLGAPPSEEEKGGRVSLSAMLNALDGLLTPHGLIVIATANNPEILDDAMMRKGRFDLHVTLHEMEWCEFEAMALAFGHEKDDLDRVSAGYIPMVPVEARNLLLMTEPGALWETMRVDRLRKVHEVPRVRSLQPQE